MQTFIVILGSFAASAVEMVEALTIVLAVGVTRGWRSTALGVRRRARRSDRGRRLVRSRPDADPHRRAARRRRLAAPRLRAAMAAQGDPARRRSHGPARRARDLRTRGRRGSAATRGRRRRHDWYAFTAGLQGRLPRGPGGRVHRGHARQRPTTVGAAAAGAVAALLVVLVVGAFVHAPLSRVPENTLKFGVGAMLTSFGMFWSGEGVGAAWPGGDLAILGIIAFVLATSLLLVASIRRNVVPSLPVTP